jgi:non-specific serine/threonine protein kinase
LTRYEAIRLFVERAAAVRSGFTVTRQNAAAIVQICRRLDGIPLALELAAARVAALTVEQIAVRLDDRFRLLTGGSRAALGRQQTLRALVDWSYDLLGDQERALLRRLAVFAGGWTLEAAEAVCADGEDADILDLLASLVNKSLVQADEWHDSARYRLLETVRQYGLEKLREVGEEVALRRRHRDWFVGLGELAATEMKGPRGANWLDRLETEHDNFRAALEWSATITGEAEAGLGLATTLSVTFWTARGHHREGRARLADLLTRTSGRTETRAQAFRRAGYLALRQGDYAAAQPLLEQGLALAGELGARAEIAGALITLGETLHGKGELDGAATLLEDGLSLARKLGDWRTTEVGLSRLADIAYQVGDHTRATALYEELLALCREHGYRHGEAYGLRGLGHLARRQSDNERSAILLAESLTLLWEQKDRRCTPLCLEGLACVASAQGQAKLALCLFGASAAQRAGLGLTLLVEQADHDTAVAVARAELDETAAAAAWAEGQAMSFDQAAEYALATAATRPPGDPGSANRMGIPVTALVSADDASALLTAREREVVSLIARGFANSEIADELVLSVRTVERHIANIYDKVGTHGKAARAAVTAFALTHRLMD